MVGAYLDRYVTEEQRSRRPIFIATLWAARLLTGCFVAHRSKTTAGILPLRFAHPVKIRSSATTQSLTWCTRKEAGDLSPVQGNPSAMIQSVISDLSPC